MRITICASSSFKKQMIEYCDKLKALGHTPIVHNFYEEMAAGRMPELSQLIATDHAKAKREGGFIKWYYNAIVNSDAILVLNFDKNGIANYIGGNTLMEIGFAHVHDKKVFLLNPVPEIGYKAEIEAMLTEVLNGDLTRIK